MSDAKKPLPCPCGSDQPYDACCGPFLAGKALPQTAEQLMRSRYTAYARQNANYLFATTLPSKRAKNEMKTLIKSFRGITWKTLEILETEKGGAGDTEGFVEFKATCEGGGETGTIHERSTFERVDGRWFYVDGDVKSAT